MIAKLRLITAPIGMFGTLISLLFLFSLPAPLANADSGISQGFTTSSTDLEPGTVVGIESGSGSQSVAVPAVSSHKYQTLGVVADKPLIALSNGSQEVQVTLSGSADALVSDINGKIKAGDKITASPITGVGMKATEAGLVVGTAQADLSSDNSTPESVTDKNGHKHTVRVGTISIQTNGSYYGGPQNTDRLTSLLPPFVFSVANSVTGRDVSALRVFISLVVLIIGFAIVGSMLHSGVRSSIISTGRNPLARKTIHRELLDVCSTALGILALSVVITFLIIKL